MWDQTLKKINHALTPQKAAVLWDAAAHSLTLVNDGINLVYRFESKGLGRYLRITHSTIRGAHEVSAAIDYQRHLCAHGAPVCKPMVSIAGNYIEEIAQGDIIFLAHVTEEVPGTIMHFDYTDQSVCTAWGKALAQLHKASQGYQPGTKFHFKDWQELWHEIAGYVALEDEMIKKEYHAIDAWFKTLNHTANDFGLTHGDHRTANVLYDGKQVHIIDFDEPVYHWFMADIAKPFLELSGKPLSEWKQKFEWYIDGYRSILPINNEQLKNISWFARMKSLDLYLWSKHNWHNPVSPDGKTRDEWLNEFRQMVFNPVFHHIFL